MASFLPEVSTPIQSRLAGQHPGPPHIISHRSGDRRSVSILPSFGKPPPLSLQSGLSIYGEAVVPGQLAPLRGNSCSSLGKMGVLVTRQKSLYVPATNILLIYRHGGLICSPSSYLCGTRCSPWWQHQDWTVRFAPVSEVIQIQ